MTQWRDIKSAPKDGSWVIGTDGSACAPMSWQEDCDDDGYTGWCGARAITGGSLYVDAVDLGFKPTHWMLLPEPPKERDE